MISARNLYKTFKTPDSRIVKALVDFSIEIKRGEVVVIQSSVAGVCHVELTFSTGFIYSADVTFIRKALENPCRTQHYTGPTQQTFIVNNSTAICQDAGEP